jgi:transposase
LPVDLREWVPGDELVHFVVNAVETMNLSGLSVNSRGTGSKQYPPRMMLALLIYCYASGIFGSRRIERATYRDLAVRYLTADTHPDHDTICTFRRENGKGIAEAFLEVLKLGREMKLLKVGTISVDGTHIKANASKHKSLRYDRAGADASQGYRGADEACGAQRQRAGHRGGVVAEGDCPTGEASGKDAGGPSAAGGAGAGQGRR